MNPNFTKNLKNYSRDGKNKIILNGHEIIDPTTIDQNILRNIYE